MTEGLELDMFNKYTLQKSTTNLHHVRCCPQDENIQMIKVEDCVFMPVSIRGGWRL